MTKTDKIKNFVRLCWYFKCKLLGFTCCDCILLRYLFFYISHLFFLNTNVTFVHENMGCGLMLIFAPMTQTQCSLLPAIFVTRGFGSFDNPISLSPYLGTCCGNIHEM